MHVDAPTIECLPAREPGGARNAAILGAAVALANIHKSYKGGDSTTHVLAGCHLNVGRGECVMLVGPSGCGKTTLLSIIGCVLCPDQGTLQILGRDALSLTASAAAELRRTQIGFVFQRFHLIRGLSALENVCVPLTLGGADPAAAARRGRELLKLVDLTKEAELSPNRLSVGQCQRVALARALSMDPPLVLADEPTASLDAETGQRAMRLLRRVTVDAGKTAIVVTHDARILSYGDRILGMDGGRLSEKSASTPAANTTAHSP